MASLLWSFRQRELTGTLALRAECHAGVSAGETLVAFERGALTQIRQPQPLDTLGCMLREQGAITGEHFDESLARMAAREGLQGEILVAMGACGDAAVARALRAQLRRKALRLFALERGHIEFFRGCDLLAGFGGERCAEDLLPLLWPGLRAYPDHVAVTAAVTRLGVQALRLRADAELAGFGFAGAAARAIELLRARPSTFAALASVADEPGSGRALVALLLTTGLAELTSEGPRRSASGVQPLFEEHPAEPARRVTSSNLPVVRDLSGRGAVPPSVPPRVIPPRPAPPNLRARLAAAEARLAAMQDDTYFQMLGVDPGAFAREVRLAHHDRTAQWSPDVVPASAIALREVHEKIQALLDEALLTLTDEAGRRRHVAEIMAGTGTPNVRRRQAAQAEALTKLNAAQVCLACGAFDEAVRAAREALAIRSELPGAIVVLVAALLAQAPQGPCIEALGWVTRGLKVTPDDDKLHVLAGRVHGQRGDAARALEHYVRAYRINSTNLDAVRELRAAAARQRGGGRAAEGEGTTAAGRLLAKLLGR